MGKSPTVVLCMPVGPQGICAATAQTIAGLFYRRALAGFVPATAHLIPGRNACFSAAVKAGADRVLWLDSDVACNVEELLDWIESHEALMRSNQAIGSCGAVYPRRGGGYSFSYDPERLDPLWLGGGLLYWHVPRVLAALSRAGRSHDEPFRWIPPMGEDYEISSLLHRFGCGQFLDSRLAVSHEGIGKWEGGAKFPGEQGSEAAIGKKGKK